MNYKLKDGLITKNINASCIYLIDCNSDEDAFFKFQGPSKTFVEMIRSNHLMDDIIEKVSSEFDDTSKTQVQADFEDFIATLKDFDLLAN